MQHCGRDRAIGIVRDFMADQCTSLGSAVVGNRHRTIRSDDIRVEVDKPVTADGSIPAPYSVRSVTSRARKTSIDVDGVPRPAGVLDNITRQIMALAAHAVRTIHRKIRVGVQVGYSLAGTRRLAEFIPALQKVGPFGSVRTIGTQAAEFAVVVAVMAIRTKNLCTHLATLTTPVQLRHKREKTRLRIRRRTRVRYRMARGGRSGKLRHDIAGIRGVRYASRREIPEFRFTRLARTRAVATKAVLVLVLSRRNRSDSIARRNSVHRSLRQTQ